MDQALKNDHSSSLLEGIRSGIWIDTNEAHIVRLDDGTHSVTKVVIDRERHKAILKARHHGSRFGDRPSASEHNEQEKLALERKRYLGRVMDAIGTSQRLVIFGPAHMKHALERAVQNDPRWRNAQVETMAADRMTPAQRVAWVKRYFG